jgi:indole-3-glycerol-phosphate lyase
VSWFSQTAFIPYITAGDPDLATTAEALRLLDACGADVIELGVPFSDPYADGPVIQASAARARASGATPDGVLAMLKEVTPELSCPVVLFSYFNPIVRWGLADFAAAVKEAGVHGLIVPDLPYGNSCALTLRTEAIKNSLELVCDINYQGEARASSPSLVLLRNIKLRKQRMSHDMNNG